MEATNPFRVFMTEWNVAHPVDHWWREKHSIPFNSPQHRTTSLIWMRCEYEEDQLYNELRRPQVPPAKVVEAYQTYQLTGQYLNGAPAEKLTDHELDVFFDNLTDLTQFNDPQPAALPDGVAFDD